MLLTLRNYVARLYRTIAGFITDRTGPPGTNKKLEEEFLKLGLQYYIAAKSSALARSFPVTGNLYHHAIEMFLKAGLCRTVSSYELRTTYGHRLRRAWGRFKTEFPVPALVNFDATIRQIDRWEELRYPESILRAQMVVDWGAIPSKLPTTTRLYRVNGTEIDQLVVKLFEVLSVNPHFFTDGLDPYAKEIIKRYHPVANQILR